MRTSSSAPARQLSSRRAKRPTPNSSNPTANRGGTASFLPWLSPPRTLLPPVLAPHVLLLLLLLLLLAVVLVVAAEAAVVAP